MFDTHCHLNFSAFKKKLDEVIINAKKSGITRIVIPGTDTVSSQKAVEIAMANDGIYAAVGIHPHHVYELGDDRLQTIDVREKIFLDEIRKIEQLLNDKKVVAVGEVGIDRHVYKQTKYEEYTVDEQFIELQKKVFAAQVKLAVTHKKSLIIHNREAKQDLFQVLPDVWDTQLEGITVLHCCEPDTDLLSFAKEHKIFLGIDGDITYSKQKQEFIKAMGTEEFLSRYVLETDAPFLLPEPLRTQKKYPNKPENIQTIVSFLSDLLKVDKKIIQDRTTENAVTLFNLF